MDTIDHIFVYGTLRRGQGACKTFGLEEHGEFVGTFKADGWGMYTLGGFPGVRAEEGQSIIGDIFKVNDPKLMDHLDRYEGEGSLYFRKVTEVNGIKCWIYEYGRQLNETYRINSGNWLERNAA